MKYTDLGLQNHELDFWIRSYKPPFPHFDFYRNFFNFSELNEKKTIDIGCGGAPISDYCGVTNINLSICDPLIDKLVTNQKYSHLAKYRYFSCSLFELVEDDYEYLICLNVIDHFNDEEYSFVDKFYSLLSEEGQIWLYYDVRNINDADHLAVNNQKLIEKIKSKFDIIKISEEINPKHVGWSSVNKSVRLIAKKK